MINKLAKEVYANAKAKGFHDKENNTGECLALIHSEVSEALEADRKNKYTNRGRFLEDDRLDSIECTLGANALKYQKDFERSIKDTFEDELADVMIRVMDLAESKGIDLEFHISQKMKYNSLRPYKHGKKY